MRKTPYIVAATLSFVISFVFSAPAALLYAWLKPSLANVELFGVDGSLYRGGAAAVRINGSNLLERLHWQLRISDLLLARIGADINSSGSTLIDGHLSRSLTALRGNDIRIAGALKPVLTALGQGFTPVDGQVSAELASVSVQDQWPTRLEGKLQIQNLAWTLARDPIILGSFQADLSRDGDDIVALVHTLGGALDVNGDARAKPDRSYELHLQIKPKPGAPPLLMSFVSSLGTPDAQGYYHLRQSGRAAGGRPMPLPIGVTAPSP